MTGEKTAWGAQEVGWAAGLQVGKEAREIDFVG